MKLKMEITPTDMNEAQQILAALSGFKITESSAVTVTESVGEVSVATRTEPAPETDVKIQNSATYGSHAESAAADDTDSELTIDNLTLGTERDSAQRLWCNEINTSTKSVKKTDNTFKRKPSLDDAYYDQIVALLDAEAAEHRASLENGAEQGPFYWSHPESDSVGMVETVAELNSMLDADACCVQIDKSEYDELVAKYNTTPAPAPAPTPAPEPQREIVAYIHQGTQYPKEQFLSFPGWTEALAAQHCEPVYADPAPAPAPAPVVSGDVDRESVRKQMMSVTNKGLAKIVRDVVTQITPEGTPNMNDIPDSELARFAAILNKAEANAEALKAGTMVVEQLLNG